MKKKLIITIATALTLSSAALVAAQEPTGHVCGAEAASAATSTQVSTATPEAVVLAFVETINAGDQEAVFALFAEDACVAYGTGACMSAERLERWWQSDIFSVEGRIEEAELTTDGSEVTLTGQYRSNGWSGRANYVFTVADGLITGWSMR